MILAAARNQRHLGLVTQFLSKEGDFVKSANRLEALYLAVSQSKAIGLALVDMDGFTDVFGNAANEFGIGKYPFYDSCLSKAPLLSRQA